MAADPLTVIRAQVEDAIADPSLEPVERVARLRDLRERMADIVGVADTYIGSVSRLREAESSRSARDVLWLRRQADLQESSEGGPDEWKGLTRGELDELAEEGLLEEVAGVMRAAWDESKHKRGPGGKFSHTDFFQAHPGQVMASTDRLRPTRQDPPEHIAKAARYADEARRGLRSKRKPLDVRENGDGTLSIIDGNSTYEALKDKLTHFPVTVGQGDPGEAATARVVDEIHRNAVAAEPLVTPALKTVTAELGGKLEGLQHRLKGPDSIRSKIARKQEKYPGMSADRAGKKVLDSVRYTAVFPATNYVQGIGKTLEALQKQGFAPYETRNYWGLQDDYDGYHAIMRGPKGVMVEVQFHTPDSLSTKEKLNHPLFEQYRDSHDPAARKLIYAQMVANSAKIEQPPGIETLGSPRQSPSAEQGQRRGESPYVMKPANGVS